MPDDALRARGVLMVHARYRQPGGEDVSVAAEAAALRAAGVPVRLLDLPPLDHAGQLLRPGRGAAALRAAVAERHPALVHLQNLWPAASPAVIAEAKRAGLPVVATLRNARLLCPAATLWRQGRGCVACTRSSWPGVLRGCWRGSRAATLANVAAHRWHPAWTEVDRFITPSAFLRDALAPALPPVPVSVVANRLPARLPSGAPERRGILYAGRLVPEKGIDLLIEAARRIDAPLTVLGQGPLAVPSARAVGSAEVLAAMAQAAVVAVPSRWPEPFGRAALEGMACGAAVVASAVGGLPEVVGAAGLLVPPDAPDALAAALSRALADHRRLGARGRARAEALAGDGAAPLLAVYRQVLAPPSGDSWRPGHGGAGVSGAT